MLYSVMYFVACFKRGKYTQILQYPKYISKLYTEYRLFCIYRDTGAAGAALCHHMHTIFIIGIKKNTQFKNRSF